MKKVLISTIIAVSMVALTACGTGTTADNKEKDNEIESKQEETAREDSVVKGKDLKSLVDKAEQSSQDKEISQWAEAYAKQIEEVKDRAMMDATMDHATYGLIYLDDDDVPELYIVISDVFAGGVDLYSFYDGGICNLGTIGSAGTMNYAPRTGITNSYSSHSGGTMDYYHKIEGDKLVPWAFFQEPTFEYYIEECPYEVGSSIYEYEEVTKQEYVRATNEKLSQIGGSGFSRITIEDGFSVIEFEKSDFISNTDKYMVSTIQDPASNHYVIYPNMLYVKADPETVRLENKLISEGKVDPEKILMMNVNDFESDGNIEAFAFVGERIDDEDPSYDGALWYISDSDLEVVSENENGYRDIDGVIANYDSKSFAYVDLYGVTNSPSVVFGVRDGRPVEESISMLGNIDVMDFGDEIIIMDSTYDCTFTDGIYIGHSWKPYFFHYDTEAEEFVEDKSRELTKDEAMVLCGFDIVAEVESRGYTANRILERCDGIVIVNYSNVITYEDGSQEISYNQANYNPMTKQYLDAWGTGENTFEGSGFGGIYKESIFEDIGIY